MKSKFQKEGYDSQIILSKHNYYRVSYKGFSKRNEAFKELKTCPFISRNKRRLVAYKALTIFDSMKSYKYSLISLLFILSACSNKKLTKIDGINTIELTANRLIPKAPSAESQRLSKTFSLTQMIENRALFNYHIVGGSSKRKNTALTLSQQLYKKGYPCRIIETHGKYRVIIQSFANKKIAVRELKRLKKLNHKPDLWILKE